LWRTSERWEIAVLPNLREERRAIVVADIGTPGGPGFSAWHAERSARWHETDAGAHMERWAFRVVREKPNERAAFHEHREPSE
jgi:hypothetical protein